MNMREAFEAWYAENAFDYAKTTIGSRDCGLQWTAFHAGAAFAARECAEIAMNLPAIDERDEIHKYRSEDTAKALAWDINIAIREAFPEAFRD